jgi:hypothetical protein
MLVESVFDLRGKPVLEPGVAPEHTKGLLGVAVRVVRPDGTAFTATVSGIEMPTPNWARRYPIQLSSSTVDQPVPIGSEVWTVGGS